MKKSLENVKFDLAALAQQLPTQHVRRAEAEPSPTPTPTETIVRPKVARANKDPEVQFNFGMPRSVRKALAQKALEADMTMRGYILAALRAKGIEVDDAVISDARRKET